MLFLLLWISAFLTSFLVLIGTLSTIFSPLAGLIGIRKAKREKLPFSLSFTMLCALYAALFIFPWIYMMAGMSNRYPYRWVIVLSYIFLYSVWLIGPIFLINMYGFQIYNQNPVVSHYTRIGCFILICSTWVVSLFRLATRPSSNRVRYVPGIMYVTPFAGLFVSLVFVLIDFYVIPQFVTDWFVSYP